MEQNIEDNLNNDSDLPFEHLIQTIWKLMNEFQSPISGSIPQSKLMIPLGVVRIIHSTVMKQVNILFQLFNIFFNIELLLFFIFIDIKTFR